MTFDEAVKYVTNVGRSAAYAVDKQKDRATVYVLARNDIDNEGYILYECSGLFGSSSVEGEEYLPEDVPQIAVDRDYRPCTFSTVTAMLSLTIDALLEYLDDVN